MQIVKCESIILEEYEYNNTNVEKNLKDDKFKILTKLFISNLIDFNYDVLRCYNLALNKKILINNIGFYCLSFTFILQIIFIFIYLIKKLKPLKYFMLIFQMNQSEKNLKTTNKNNIAKIIKNNFKTAPPFKNKYSIKNGNNDIKKINKGSKYIIKQKNKIISKIIEENKDRKKILKNNDPINNDLKINNSKDVLKIQSGSQYDNCSNNTMIISYNFAPTINIKKPLFNIKKNSKDINNLIQVNNKKINDVKSIKFKIKRKAQNKKEKLTNFMKDFSKMETMQRKNNIFHIKSKVNNINLIKFSKTDSDLQDLNYEEAIIYDKRSYLKMYWGFLVDSQIILGTCCTDNYLDLFVIKLSFLVFTFQISFFLNALFYTDEYISDAYHNDGVLDFLSGLPKSIYSFFATLITTNLLRMLSSSKNELMRVIRTNRRYQNYKNIIDIKLTKLRKKLIIYFILVYLLDSFFLYFVTVFCAVYKYSQKYWFIGCLESFGIDSLVALITCLFLALLRYISIKTHIKCFYIFANIINIFI